MSRIAQREQWEKDRGQLKRTEAETTFGSILADLVKDPMTSWSGLKKNLRRDHRWDMCETIELEEKETMFKNHISKLEEKRRLQFRKLLEETSKVDRDSRGGEREREREREEGERRCDVDSSIIDFVADYFHNYYSDHFKDGLEKS